MTDVQLNKRVTCADGFSMSVQANSYAYCLPRLTTCDAYQNVEVGFPSAPEPLLAQYQECPDMFAPEKSVYPYVPASVVLAVVEKHGGVVDGNLPPLKK